MKYILPHVISKMLSKVVQIKNINGTEKNFGC